MHANLARSPAVRRVEHRRAAGVRFLEDAEAVPWSAEGERARAYLHGRGLNDETLRVWRLGFQPQEGRRDPAERWGFLVRTASGRPAWVRIPRGIVLPWLLDRELWQLKIRTNRQQAEVPGHQRRAPVPVWG